MLWIHYGRILAEPRLLISGPGSESSENSAVYIWFSLIPDNLISKTNSLETIISDEVTH